MDPVLQFLLLVAGLFLLGAAGEFIFGKTRIPDVIWMVGAGVLLGPVFEIVPIREIQHLVPFFGAVALIIILFEGGTKLVLGEVAAAAPRAVLLSMMSFGASIGVVLGAGWLCANYIELDPSNPLQPLLAAWTPLHGVLIGAIIGGSSSLIVMPSMAAAKVEGTAARLAEMESTVTDALCIVVTMAMLNLLVTGQGGLQESLQTLGREFGLAFLLGTMAACMWLPLLHIMRGNHHAYTFTLAALFLLYTFVQSFGGNAAMGILAFAIIIGNAKKLAMALKLPIGAMRLELDFVVRSIHTQMAFIMKSFFFTFIGLMLPLDPVLLIPGVLLAVLIFAGRIPVVRLAVVGAGLTPSQRKMVTVAMPRGMAAGILATLPFAQMKDVEGVAVRALPETEPLAPVVFAAVVTTIVIFTVGFRMVGSPDAEPDADTADDGEGTVAAAPDESVPAPTSAAVTVDEAAHPAAPATDAAGGDGEPPANTGGA